MNKKSIAKTESYDLLSRIGKKVLRPGGLKLTQKLIQLLDIQQLDEVVEFAPGLGFTAAITLSKSPKSYTGIERDEHSVKSLKKKFTSANCTFINANVASSGLPDGFANKVYGEAMLTMHADHRKMEIIAEAHRILKPNGLYGIHELGIDAKSLTVEELEAMQKELAQVSHVNARPLGVREWQTLLENQGFKVVSVETSEMLLLEPSRILADEGFFNFVKILLKLLTRPQERKRVLLLRKTFKKYRKYLTAVVLVVQKTEI